MQLSLAGGALLARPPPSANYPNVEVTATVTALDPQTHVWQALPPMPTPRFGLAVVTGSDGLIYAIGGGREVEAYDPVTQQWSRMAPATPGARQVVDITRTECWRGI